jgi:uncharacterized protein (DUF2062 family)
MTPALIISGHASLDNIEVLVRDAQCLAPHVIIADAARSYASGLLGAFARATELGCTHAVALDVSRRHSPCDLKLFLDASERHPDAIVTGARHYSAGTLPAAVRWARRNCDFWTWAESGRWIHDCAYGYRAYPLAGIRDILVRSADCEVDVELLVKAMWMEVPVVEIPLTIEPGPQRSVLLPIREIVAFSTLTATLMFQRILFPPPLRGAIQHREFASLPLRSRVRLIVKGAIDHHCDRPRRFAASVGIGVFFGIVPIWGFQLIAATAAAHLFRLSKPLVLAACHVSSPLTIPLILYTSLVVGHLLHHGHLAGLPRLDQLHRPQLLQYLGEYLLGSTVLATVSGGVAAMLAYLAAAALKSLRGNT